MMRVGTHSIDITPADGLALSGFAARTGPATGCHDALSARAVVVDDTAIVCCDVLGLDRQTTTRIRDGCSIDANGVVVTALHTHGAPDAMPGRVGREVSPAFLEQVTNGCIAAIDRAAATRQPCRLETGTASAPGIARNRRHPDGPVDTALPVAIFRARSNGAVIAVIVGYACHPVVLGANNRLYTADYPHYVRTALECAFPGALALFLTGAAGDANSGHSAADSLTLGYDDRRTYVEAARLGTRLARLALVTKRQPSRSSGATVRSEKVPLSLQRRESVPLSALVSRWRDQHRNASPVERLLLEHWLHWAETTALPDSSNGPVAGPVCRVSLVRWGDLRMIMLPGEVFAATAQRARQRLADAFSSELSASLLPRSSPGTSFIVGYADDNPGYLPPPEEYVFGGYEVEEAHRYYGLPASFAPDSESRLLAATERLAAALSCTTP